MTNGPVAAEELRLLIERWERLDEERQGIVADQKDVLAEAKSRGFDPKIIREIIKLRKMTPDDRREREALIDTYKAALGMLDGTPLGNWAVQRLTKTQPAASPGEDQPLATTSPAPATGDAAPASPEEPPLSVEDARRLGGEAAAHGAAVTDNPFPARDPRRAAWDEAWCQALGSDGMDIPDALKPTPKPKKAAPGDEPKGGGE